LDLTGRVDAMGLETGRIIKHTMFRWGVCVIHLTARASGSETELVVCFLEIRAQRKSSKEGWFDFIESHAF
jgi:hypothetical protein